jgi:GTP-binding protein EngB required for normal cell division
MSRGFVALFRSFFSSSDISEGNTTAVSIDISSGNNLTTIYGTKPKAAILGSVFAQSIDKSTEISNGHRNAVSNAGAVAAKIRVGETLRLAKDKTVAHGEHLFSLSDEVTRRYIERILTIFHSTICNIAVIGQMNAGKSTLINAFIGQPDLLPAEITPWTTVVTNLHFGIPSSTNDRAVFEFFDADEWQRLAEGSARLRELTERLIPNFDWSAFYRQVGDMQTKARQKLGPEFETLLGGTRGYSEITQPLLRKYVCAEPPLDSPDEFGTGEFSLITKAANLYFDLGGFFYPTLVIDTPGINDPFLVRDEITRQNLERANIFIIVVTARQPLSNADVDLLRILRGLDKDRIIIFVNKIDEIEEFPEVETAILHRVEGVLKKEFPSARIPVIMGSARWAAEVLSAEQTGRLPDLPSPRAAAFGDEGKDFLGFDRSVQDILAAEDVMMRSGVPALALAISDMMQSGPIADCLNFSTIALAAVATNAAACAAANADFIAGLLASSDTVGPPAGKGAALGDIEAIAGEIRECIDTFDAETVGRIGADFEVLRQTLRSKLDDLAAGMAARSGDQRMGDKSIGQSVNVMPLRAAIEQDYSTAFLALYAAVVDRTRHAETDIQDFVERVNAGGLAIVYLPLPGLKLTPPLGPLGDPIALASGGTVQAEWWRQQISPRERSARFRELVQDQFANIIEKLCEEGAREIERATDFMLSHFRMSVLHCLEASATARRTHLDNWRQMHTSDAAEAAHAKARLEEALRTFQSDAEACRKIARELTTLTDDTSAGRTSSPQALPSDMA